MERIEGVTGKTSLETMYVLRLLEFLGVIEIFEEVKDYSTSRLVQVEDGTEYWIRKV